MQSLRRTRERRPDLLKQRVFTDEERELLEEILNEPGAFGSSGH
jgi:tRNA (guanine37-N1)-methyltransferase